MVKCKKQKEHKELYISTRKRKEKEGKVDITLQEIVLNDRPFQAVEDPRKYKGIFKTQKLEEDSQVAHHKIPRPDIFAHINPPDITHAYIKNDLEMDEITDWRGEISQIKHKLKSICENQQKWQKALEQFMTRTDPSTLSKIEKSLLNKLCPDGVLQDADLNSISQNIDLASSKASSLVQFQKPNAFKTISDIEINL